MKNSFKNYKQFDKLGKIFSWKNIFSKILARVYLKDLKSKQE